MDTILVAEDELILRQHLVLMLNRNWPEPVKIIEASNGEEALRVIETNDLICAFLDIQMPGPNGLDVAKLANKKCPIVFLTAYSEHAIKAFEYGVCDYILKPITDERLQQSIQRTIKYNQMSLSEEVEDANESLPEELRYLNFVKAGLGNSIYLISVKDIYYFMSDDKYTKVRSKDKEALINIPLKELEKQLDPKMFLRVRRSHIVNLDKVKAVRSTGIKKKVIDLSDIDEELPIGRRFNHLFKKM